jgi:hypothetical protein
MPVLDDMPGVRALRERTRGDPRVLVAVIDGPPVTDHPAFEGADFESVRGYWVEDDEAAEWAVGHATHITSVILGQPGSPVPGLAPRCRGLFIATGINEDTAESEIGVARAIEYALSRGAQIIHCAFCHPNQTGAAQSWMVDAVRKAEAAGAVIVAPAGNDYGENWCVPSTFPEVLAVGALADDGAPMHFTNFGELYAGHSIMGPGENVLGATPDGGVKAEKGTSVAAPVLTGLIAALTSAVVRAGRAIAPQQVRDVLIATARPCTGSGAGRCIGGEVAVDRAIAVLLDGMTIEQARMAFPDGPVAPDAPAALPVPPRVAHYPLPPHSGARHRVAEPEKPREAYKREERFVTASGVEPSLRYPAQFFGIGAVGYEFPDQGTRDSFLREMDARIGSGDPEDPERLIGYLDANPAEARRLLWTVSINGERRYAALPSGPFAAQIYDMLTALALGFARGEISVASVPGRALGTTRVAMDGTVLRDLRVPSLRGVYGWEAHQVVAQSLAAVHRDALSGGVGQRDVAPDAAVVSGDGAENAVLGIGESPLVGWPRLRETPSATVESALIDLVNLVYFRADQEPEVSRDRALNFAVTNGYQVAAAFLDAMGDGLQCMTYSLAYSPFARVGGNCWDVILRFNDPVVIERASREYRMTVDIADVMPVTVGRLRRWAG